MKFLSSIEIPGRQQKYIELYQGDVTALKATEGFDLLIVSAFSDGYTSMDNSLIGALYRKGLSVEALAMKKDVDLRENFSCWLSNEFTSQNPGLRFRRILCFESLIRGKPPELVGDIFRALTPVLAERPEIKTLSLPIFVADDRDYSIPEMLTPLLEAAFHWLKTGLPLDRIKIVLESEAQSQEALRIFSDSKDKYSPPPMFSRGKGKESIRFSQKGKDSPSTGFNRSGRKDNSLQPHNKIDLKQLVRLYRAAMLSDDFLSDYDSSLQCNDSNYDIFISYSRANASESEALEQALRQARPDIRVFVDRKEINIGSAWQPRIFESLDKCRKVVTLLSPDYLSSKMCKEEYNIAWIRSRETDEDIIFPIYLYTAGLPTYMKYRNYVDCREGDRSKIVDASRKLLAALKIPGL